MCSCFEGQTSRNAATTYPYHENCFWHDKNFKVTKKIFKIQIKMVAEISKKNKKIYFFKISLNLMKFEEIKYKRHLFAYNRKIYLCKINKTFTLKKLCAPGFQQSGWVQDNPRTLGPHPPISIQRDGQWHCGRARRGGRTDRGPRRPAPRERPLQ
jgi:hypothetical protein